MNSGRRIRILTLGLVAVLPVVARAGEAAPSPASSPDAAYVQAFETWKAGQIDDLKQNWLPVGRLVLA